MRLSPVAAVRREPVHTERSLCGIYGGQSALRLFVSVWYPSIVDSALALVSIFTERWLGRALARQVANPVKTK